MDGRLRPFLVLVSSIVGIPGAKLPCTQNLALAFPAESGYIRKQGFLVNLGS